MTKKVTKVTKLRDRLEMKDQIWRGNTPKKGRLRNRSKTTAEAGQK